jgi:hypothetical protein
VQAVTGDEGSFQENLLVLVRQSSVASVKSNLKMELSIEHLIGAVERSEGNGLRVVSVQMRACNVNLIIPDPPAPETQCYEMPTDRRAVLGRNPHPSSLQRSYQRYPLDQGSARQGLPASEEDVRPRRKDEVHPRNCGR